MAHRKSPPPLFRYFDQRQRFYRGVLSLSSLDECENFFIDLLTEPELYELTKRFYIAELLLREKEMPIRKIEKAVRAKFGEASSTTVGRVKNALNGKASRGGYTLVFDKMQDAD